MCDSNPSRLSPWPASAPPSASSRGGGNDDILNGDPQLVAGNYGSALEFDGDDDYVNIDGYKGILADENGVQHPFTITCWFKTTGNGEMVTWGESYRFKQSVQKGKLKKK